MQRVVTTNKEDEQDETVQESSGCGAGGRYGSLHADGMRQQQISKVKDALKDFDIKMDAAMVQDTEKMMGGLQQLTEKVTSGAVKLNDETQMKKISEKFGEMTDYTFSSSTGKGDYDLYIWTNGADGRPASGGKTERYPYLMKVQNVHVSEKNLPRLLDKEFIQKGEFSGNSEALDILRSLLKVANVEKAGISVGKAYGKDVLLVTVPAGTTIPQTAAPKTLTT